MDNNQNEKPCIKIYTYRADGRNVRALCAGMEEEMIPFELKEISEVSVEKLAFQAAESSRLEVGVGLSDSSAALHYRKLDPEKPLFILHADQVTEDALHDMGANAARLVKGIPFKE